MPTAKVKGKTAPLIPEGLHLAVCYAVIDLGTHHNDKFDKDEHKVCIIWEFPNIERVDMNGAMMPRVKSMKYTLSLHKKAILRQHLEAWRGKAFTEEQLEGFVLDALVGANCQIQIIHENDYANIGAIVNVPAGHKKLKPETPTVVYDIPNPIPEDKIPGWLVEEIKASQEWKNEVLGEKPAPSYDEKPPEETSDVEPF